MHKNLNICRSNIVYLACLNLTLFYRFGDRIDEAACSLTEWYLADNECLVVEFVYLGSYLQCTTSLSIIVFTYIDGTACREVGIELEWLALEIVDGSIANLIEIMWQNLTAQSHGNTLGTLCQEQREFGRERDRLLVSAIIRELPVGGFRIENHIESKLREACLDISGSSSTVARKNVSPVTLRIDEQVFLSHLYQSISDRRITMRVKLHGMSHDIGNLVVSSVVHALHRVEDASLYRFQTILNMRNGTLEDHIRCIVEEPVLIHSAEVMYSRSIESVHRLIIGMFFGRNLLVGIFRSILFRFCRRIFQIWRFFLFKTVFIFNFVAHI